MTMIRAIAAALLIVCHAGYGQQAVDRHATKRTRNLLINLNRIAESGFMVGHQDALAYGVGWRDEPGRSDVLETAGSYPAVYGWDIGARIVKGRDDERLKKMTNWVKEAYRMGGVNTFSWHIDNLTTGSNSWDKTPSVQDILPGGDKHQEFLDQLDLLAELFDGFRVGFTKIPVVFRPWHEHNGDWFWWGKGNCTEEEYIRLFRFTVDYLRKVKKVNHVLYAFSPDRSRLRLDSMPEQNYLYGYPGDDYVDIIGLDNYGDVGRLGGPDTPEVQRENFTQGLALVTAIARKKNKVAALTETGLEGVTNPEWFTEVILDPIRACGDSIAIAWILVWRNANDKHHYAPYAGHGSVADFARFRNDPLTYFQSDVRNLYRRNKSLVREVASFNINP